MVLYTKRLAHWFELIALLAQSGKKPHSHVHMLSPHQALRTQSTSTNMSTCFSDVITRQLVMMSSVYVYCLAVKTA